MSLTVTFDGPRTERLTKEFGRRSGTIAFDSNYPFGGESISDISKHFRSLKSLRLQPTAGYSFEYDYTNGKVKAFCKAPVIVIDEQHTIASNAITLNYPAAFIFGMASATATQLLTDPGATLAANEVKPSANFTAGARPTFTFHASTSGAIKVSYVTQAWRELWLQRVNPASFATATHVASLGAEVLAIETIRAVGTTGTNRSKVIEAGDTVATTEVELDWSDAAVTDFTTLTFVSTDVITSAVVTYLTLPASGFLAERKVEDEAITIASQLGATSRRLLIPRLCGQLPDSHAAGCRAPHHLGMPEDDAVGTGQEFRWDYHRVKTLLGTQLKVNDSTTDTVTAAYVYGEEAEIPGVVPLEEKDGVSLAALSEVRFVAEGTL